MRYFFISLLIIFSGIYIQGFIFSPVYIFLIFSGVGLFSIFLLKGRIWVTHSMSWAFISILYWSSTQLLIGGETNTLLTILVSLSYFIICTVNLKFISQDKMLIISRRFVNVSIIMLLVECFWRLTHPNYLLIPRESNFLDLGFYAYKYNSIMYQDSNFVSIFCLCVFFFQFYLMRFFKERQKYKLYILSILCVLTFSRAAILTLFLCMTIFIALNNKIVKIKLSSVLVAATIFGVFSLIVLKFFGFDGSFISKFEIISDTLNFYKHDASLLQKLLGVGVGNSEIAIYRGAHNIAITLLLESGVIGFILFAILWFQIALEAKWSTFYIMLPFCMVGFSLTTYLIPYMYCVFAIIAALNANRQKADDQGVG